MRPQPAVIEERALPHNLEMEQAMLGAILVFNEAYERVSEFLKPKHFFEPLHGRIYQACQTLIEAGKKAGPAALRNYFKDDEALKQVGGGKYLARLAVGAVSITAAADYGRAIYDLAVRRELIALGEEMSVKAAAPKPDDSAETILREFEARLGSVKGAPLTERTVWGLQDSLKELLDDHDARQRGERSKALIAFGIPALDGFLGGLERGELSLIAARPSMGKSALMCEMALYQAYMGYNVAVFSIDMEHKRLAARMASAHLARNGVYAPYEDANKGRLDSINRAAFNEAMESFNLPLLIDDGPAPTISKVVSRIREWNRALARADRRLDVVYVDHIHKMGWDSGSRNEEEAVKRISNGLTSAAREFDVAMCALAQLNRQVETRENKRPMLADLRYSGALEQDARLVLFPFREYYYRMKSKPDESKTSVESMADWQAETDAKKHLIEFNIAKQNNGPEGTVTSYCDLAVNLITDKRPGR